ncbi:Spermidine/putrescine import ATP-binding protein PotA [Marinibacterium anthonyi]|nr:Spermidine/putrescine import ATP-binding protein PotA [Marinibacterium anthonyi]
MTTALLTLSSLQKHYGEARAVAGIDLSLRAGEFVTLLGPSGCGKTTTLMMVAGFETPSSGDILLEGASITATPASRRGFGMVFQSYALFPHMSVAENVGYPMRMRGIRGKARAKAVDEALDLVRLGGFGARYPAQLSGGQQQRVALARALVFRPRLLLMDEPLGALDKNLRDEMQAEIVRIQRDSGAAAIFVTHDQDEALRMSDRVVVMRGGKIEQIDTPSGLYDRPATAFVANFLGESNLLEVDRTGPGEGVIAGGVRVPLPPGSPDPAMLVLRPERLRLDAAAPDGAIALPVEVTGVIYRGSEVAVDLTCGGQALRALVPNRSGERSFAPGDTVTAWWRPEDGALASR